MSSIFFEDFRPGEVFSFGDREVTREEIVAFASAYDPQPFHLDEEAGRRSILGGLAASGWHSACLLMRLNCDHWLNETASLGGPGVEEMRWLKPVYPGDRLSVRRTVLEARASASRPALGIVGFLFEVANQRGDVVLTQKNAIMVGRREGPAPEPGAYDLPRGAGDAPPVASDEIYPLRFSEMKPGVEHRLGAFTFGRDEIVDFARQFDPQPFHLSEEAAAKSPFGRLAASGWQSACVWMRLMIDARRRAEAAARERGETIPGAGPSPGYRDLKWARPVYVGDTVHYASRTLEARATSKPGWGVATHHNTGVNQHGERVFEFTSTVFTPIA
ncbi:MAG: MaoC family dehydratase [Rhizobiales bacterium]|nr:MaoC family dehydratase [Hyphomicrobiales bacterium]